MSLLIECPCGQTLSVHDDFAGKKVKCPTCGNVVVAPAPAGSLEVLEMIEEDKAPTVSVRPGAKSLETPPAWERKKRPKSKSAREEDDDEHVQPAPFWVFPGKFSSEVLALADDGIYFATLKGDVLKGVLKMLKERAHPGNALGKSNPSIPWDSVVSIYCNKRLRGFAIRYTYRGESVTKKLLPADLALQEDIFKTLREFLGESWGIRTVRHTRVTATLFPLVCIVLDLAVTAALIVFHNSPQFWKVWTGVSGVGIAVALTVWLIVRIVTPPIEVSIHPK